MSAFKDLTNQKFGKLTAIRRVENDGKNVQWLCRCDCGKEITTRAVYLTSGHRTSCDCLISMRAYKHGLSNSRIRQCYINMKKRCDNPNCKSYKDYGGRGITYCDKWKTFSGFLEDMLETYKDGLTLERIDYNGNYCKENCKWATKKEQANNTRSNHYVIYNGEKLTVTELAEKHNVSYSLLLGRINSGWTVESALNSAKLGELITFNGSAKTIADFAKDYGLTYHQVKRRLMRGWSIEKALTEPLRKW